MATKKTEKKDHRHGSWYAKDRGSKLRKLNFVRHTPHRNQGISAERVCLHSQHTLRLSCHCRTRSTWSQGGNVKDIVRAFESLYRHSKVYLELHGYACEPFKRAAEREMEQNWQRIPELHRRALAIYAANAFATSSCLDLTLITHASPIFTLRITRCLGRDVSCHTCIAAGEELTITYISGTNPTQEVRGTPAYPTGDGVIVSHELPPVLRWPSPSLQYTA